MVIIGVGRVDGAVCVRYAGREFNNCYTSAVDDGERSRRQRPLCPLL